MIAALNPKGGLRNLTHLLSDSQAGELATYRCLQNHTSIDDSVLLVGPGALTRAEKEGPNGKVWASLPMDPGLPFLAHYLSSGNGRITVLDLPGSYGGHGLRCPRGVKNQMDVWGMQSALGSYFFVEGDILLPPMSDSSFDVITEHNTLSWVTGWSLRSLSDVIKNYFRLLKEGGKALLFYQCFGKLNEESMLGQAQETGFKVSQVRNLIDKYPLDDQIAKDYSLYEKDMVTLDGAVSPFYPCKYLIVLEKPKHPDSQHLQHALR